jgi:molecular chaperone GrpE
MNGQPDRPADDAEQAEVTEQADAAEPEMGADSSDDPEARIATLQAKADENWDRYLRAAAETENVRKRAVRDVEHARKYALEAFSKEVLAVRDSFELGLEAADSADAASLAEGSKATLKLLITTLERFGINEVDPLGEPFDPELHQAISVQPSAEAEPGSVLIVVQKGYSLNGRLLRPAMVVVSAAPAEE